MFPGAVSLTVRQVVVTDDGLGNGSEVVTEHVWAGCIVAPRFARESSAVDAPQVVVGREVYSSVAPPVDLGPDDRVLIGSDEWQVDGDSADWPWPAGGMAGFVVALKRVP